ncbi:MAG: GNAT family N-acetyltransferase [Frankia sp.]|nr:GNAT family N-acetyltransferase [Frankia sp.]
MPGTDSVEIRSLTADDVGEFIRITSAAFSDEPNPADAPYEEAILEPARLLAAFDDSAMVATTGAFSFEMTVPGASAPVAGVTCVGVLPTYRRRGVLTRLMRHQLDDIRARGEAVAALWASEGSIYGRFGYGAAAWSAATELDTRATAMRADTRVADVRLRLVPSQDAAALLAAPYDAARTTRPGMFARNAAFWSRRMTDFEHRRHGGGPMFVVVAESGTDIVGYALYRVRQDWSTGSAAGTVDVRELVGAGPDVEAALWRYLVSIDLVRKVEAWTRPVDDALPALLSDSRQAKRKLSDNLWVRVVDVPRALAQRRYAVPGHLVVEVTDDFCPWNTGRYALDATGDSATCEPTTHDADLALGAAELGAAYLGGTSLQSFVGAGRVTELTPGAVRRADALFRWTPAPWCPEVF